MKRKNKIRSLALDTNIFIYHLDSRSPFHDQASHLLEEAAQQRIKITTSIITLIEILSFRAPTPQIKFLERELTNISNLRIMDINLSIGQEAAKIRRAHGFTLPDAIQLATAFVSRVGIFLSNDQKLAKFKDLKVVTLKEAVSLLS